MVLSSYVCLAQSVASVDPSTGAPHVVIPIYTINRGQVSFPINLMYNASGIKVKDIEGSAGMGWNVTVNWGITRTVRGLPDDITQDIDGYSRAGWMYNTKQATISGFSIANDNNPSTCTDATSDLNYISSNFNDLSDTEPDVFYVSAPGLSCALIWDQSAGKFRVIGYDDMVISYTYNATTTGTYSAGCITSFTITNDKGITYTFGSPDRIREYTAHGPGTYFQHQYQEYQNPIIYNNNWHLISMIDQGGNGVILQYQQGDPRPSSNSVNLYMPGSTNPTLQYDMGEIVTPQLLSTIEEVYFDNIVNTFSFQWGNMLTTAGTQYIYQITGAGHQFGFSYANAENSNSYPRAFLTSFDDGGCNSPVNYTFSYNGVNTTAGTITLPDSTSAQVDYWGYYNGSTATSLMPKVLINPSSSTLPSVPQYSIYNANNLSYYPYYTTSGNDRSANATTAQIGSLTGITYAAGGSTTISYQSNDYLDPISGKTIQGGGVRVSQIIDAPSSTATNSITRTYTYTTPGTSNSSGVPVSLPVYAFNVPYSGSATGNTLYNDATVVSDNDLSSEDHTIMYQYVQESEPNMGYTQYQYSVPATNWSTTATGTCSTCSTSEWAPTVNYTQPITCGSTTHPVLNNSSGYPFSANPNFDSERGLLLKKSVYNASSVEVSEENYTYAQLGTVGSIPGFIQEDLPYATGSAALKSYAKYSTLYNIGEVPLSVTTKVYDSNGQSTSLATTVNYTYGSANHKLVTSESVTNSDNSTLTTNYKYVKDYTATGTDPHVVALYNLQQKNINVPVETWQQITRSGTTLTTSGSLMLFNTFASNHIWPSQSLRLSSPGGISGFTPSSVNSTVTYNSGYYPVANYDLYDYYGDLQHMTDFNGVGHGSVIDNMTDRQVIDIKGASPAEVVYSSFDGDAPGLWSGGENGTLNFTPPAGGHTGNSAGLGTNQNFSYTLTKNASATGYIFSIWINAAAAGTLNVSVAGGSTSTSSIAYAGNNAWTYYETKPIPVSALTSPMTLTVTASTNIGVDDILFYPSNADVSTFAYDPNTRMQTAATDMNGVSTYSTYDQWGRLLTKLDQDKNILIANSYVTADDYQGFTTPSIGISPIGTNFTTLTPITFNGASGTSFCSGVGVVFNWDFGDGNTAQVAYPNTVNHTYATPGTYTVKLTVTSPLLGSKTATPVSVTVAAPTATVTISGHAPGGGITGLTFTNSAHTYNIATSPATIAPGTYTVSFTETGNLYNPSTGKGLTNVVFSDGPNAGGCYGYSTSTYTFTWTVNAGDTLDFGIYNNNYCPFN